LAPSGKTAPNAGNENEKTSRSGFVRLWPLGEEEGKRYGDAQGYDEQKEYYADPSDIGGFPVREREMIGDFIANPDVEQNDEAENCQRDAGLYDLESGQRWLEEVFNETGDYAVEQRAEKERHNQSLSVRCVRSVTEVEDIKTQQRYG
jgi:hypothetical protein